jgi:hypothetical protein
MSPKELNMQPTIHLERKAGHLPRPPPALRSKCIVGCIFNSVGLITTDKSPCIFFIAVGSVSCTVLIKINKTQHCFDSFIF